MAEQKAKVVHGPGPRGMGGPRPKVENPGKLLKRIMAEVFQHYLPHCILVLICIVVSALANVQASLFLQILIDDYIIPMTQQQDPSFAPLAGALVRVGCIYVVGILAAWLNARIMVNVTQGTLGDVDHDAGVEPCSEDAHHIDAADAHQRTGQRCKAGVLLLGHGDDIVVDKDLQEQACLHIGQRTDHDADEHEDAVRQIVLEHLCHDALEQLARVLDLRTRASHAAGAGAMDDFCFLFCHYCSPPCLSKSPPP